MNDAIKGFIRAFVILFCIGLVVGIIRYNKYKFTDEDLIDYYKKQDEIDKKEFLIEENGNKFDINKAKELYKKFNYKTVQDYGGNEFYNIYYDNEPLNNEFVLFISIINMYSEKLSFGDGVNEVVEGKIVREYILSLFNDDKYVDTSYNNKQLNILYDKDLDKYNLKIKPSESSSSYVATTYVNSYEKDGYVYITEYAYYVDNKYDSSKMITYYHKGPSKDSVIIGNSNESILTDLTFEKYNLKFRKDNDKYYFVGVFK